MRYNRIVEEYFFNPEHVGILDLSVPRTVCVSSADFSSNRTVIKLYMHCDKQHIVVAMRFKTNGNPYTIALLEWLCRETIGNNISQLDYSYEQLVARFEIPFTQAPTALQVYDVYKEILNLIKKIG